MLDVIIIGAGAAGLSAALWCDGLGLDTLVLEADSETGGQLLRVYNPINNYLGVQAENGRALRDQFAAQTEAAEFDLWTEVEIERVDLAAKRVRLRSGEELQAICLVIATGVSRRRLGVPGEAEFAGRGVLASGVGERDTVADDAHVCARDCVAFVCGAAKSCRRSVLSLRRASAGGAWVCRAKRRLRGAACWRRAWANATRSRAQTCASSAAATRRVRTRCCSPKAA